MRNYLRGFKNIFLYYSPKKKYDFSLSNNSNKQNTSNTIPNIISTSLDTNLSNLKLRYTSSINSDIILREFNLNIFGKDYKALIVCIDGMIDSDLVNNYLLRPLMQTNSKQNSKKINLNGVKIQKNKKLDLKKYIHDTLIPQNDINEAKSLDQLILRSKRGKLCSSCRHY